MRKQRFDGFFEKAGLIDASKGRFWKPQWLWKNRVTGLKAVKNRRLTGLARTPRKKDQSFRISTGLFLKYPWKKERKRRTEWRFRHPPEEPWPLSIFSGPRRRRPEE